MVRTVSSGSVVIALVRLYSIWRCSLYEFPTNWGKSENINFSVQNVLDCIIQLILNSMHLYTILFFNLPLLFHCNYFLSSIYVVIFDFFQFIFRCGFFFFFFIYRFHPLYPTNQKRHTPTVYSTATSFRSSYPTSLPINTSLSR